MKRYHNWLLETGKDATVHTDLTLPRKRGAGVLIRKSAIDEGQHEVCSTHLEYGAVVG